MLQRLLFALALGCAAASCGALDFRHPVEVNHPVRITPSGALYRDVYPGEGRGAAPGDRVRVHYSVEVKEGGKVDSSVDRGVPADFVIGEAPLEGWNEGLVGLRVGGRRELELSPDLAYGPEGIEGLVPPNSTLVCSVELLELLDSEWD